MDAKKGEASMRQRFRGKVSKAIVGFDFESFPLIAIEALLIATPILVICTTVMVNPVKGKGFVDTVLTKPEWYFITLVFCIEAFRDWLRIHDRTRAVEESPGLLTSLALILLGVVLAVSATLASLSGHAPSVPTAPLVEQVVGISTSTHVMTTPSISLSTTKVSKSDDLPLLQILSVPLFLLSALWSGYSKVAWKQVERQSKEDGALLADIARPRVYNAEKAGRAKAFYDAVAAAYNERNDKTKGIRSAHNILVEQIYEVARRTNDGIAVLDIGAGSGYNVYNSLRNEKAIEWTALDVSGRMLKKFKDDFPQALTMEGDCLELLPQLSRDKKFDVVVLSFVLSSMPRTLDFEQLAGILKPNGVVLLTDIHPGYIAKSPCFDIEVDHEVHALRLRKVEPLVLEREASAHFERDTWQLFDNERGETYAFVMRLQRRNSEQSGS